MKSNNTIILWKDFSFPMSIESFTVKEDAKVATYEYAGRSGAEHERVLAYRVFSIAGRFTTGSGDKSPSYYAQKLRKLNDNVPGVLGHPIFGTYRCICKSLTIINDGAELESSNGETVNDTISGKTLPQLAGGGATAYIKSVNVQGQGISSLKKSVPNYKFTVEFWETTPPNSATLQSQSAKLFPANSVKPVNDNYQTSSKYATVMELYWALVNGKIKAGIDPILNAEWLAYDYGFRKEAYDKWIFDPKGATYTQPSNSGAISVLPPQNTYTVAVGDTILKIAKNIGSTPDSIFQKNVGKKVRKVPKGSDGLYWKKISSIYPGDTLLLP